MALLIREIESLAKSINERDSRWSLRASLQSGHVLLIASHELSEFFLR